MIYFHSYICHVMVAVFLPVVGWFTLCVAVLAVVPTFFGDRFADGVTKLAEDRPALLSTHDFSQPTHLA